MSSIYWIDGPWKGKLAIVARPRGHEWLPDDIAFWRRSSLAVVISLLTHAESQELGLLAEADEVRAAGLDYFSFPIADRSTPLSLRQTQLFVEQIAVLLAQGKNIGMHCRQGVGRSALLAASLMVHGGANPARAFEQIARRRGSPVPDTLEQKEWVERYAVLVQAQRTNPVIEADVLRHITVA